MAYPVTMPALGESVTEGTVTRWLKQVGDRVEVDEPLLEVSTDKVDTEIPSPVAGVLTQVLVGEDETVEVGAQLAVIGDQVPEGGPTGAGTPDGEGAQPTASAPEAAAAPAAPAQTVPVAAPVGPAAPAPVTPTPPTAPAPAAAAPAPSPAAAPAAPAAPSETGPGAPPQGAPQEGTTVTMPALGESVTEGTVTRWLKQVGDRVEVDEPLLEVSTDKVDTEIPSPTAGVLTQVLVGEDETVEVGAPLAVIGGGVGAGGGPAQAAPTTAGVPQPQPPAEPEAPMAEEASLQQQAATQSAAATTPPAPATATAPAPAGPAAPAPAPPAAAPTPTPTPAPETPTTQPPEHAPASPPPGQVLAPSAPQTRQPVESGAPAPAAPAPTGAPSGGEPSPYVTPLVRRLAAEHGVDLSTVTGTGVGGRIRKQDVLAAAEAARTAPPAAPQPPTPQPATGAPAPGGPAAAAQPVSPLRGTRERMSRLRRLIATRMVESLQTAAQLTTVVEVDVTRIARLRARARDSFLAREGVKLSFLPFFAEATVEALKVHPKLNATIEDDEIVYPDAEHLGVAVDTERGLLVPVIKNAGDLNLAGLARKIADLAERTRTNRITPDELSGGTFTLTNTGSRGALFDTPIINQPQVGVLGTGTVVKRPVVIDDPDLGETIAVRSVVLLALTYDHRLVDGADAARFLTTIKNRLEEGAFEAELGL